MGKTLRQLIDNAERLDRAMNSYRAELASTKSDFDDIIAELRSRLSQGELVSDDKLKAVILMHGSVSMELVRRYEAAEALLKGMDGQFVVVESQTLVCERMFRSTRIIEHQWLFGRHVRIGRLKGEKLVWDKSQRQPAYTLPVSSYIYARIRPETGIYLPFSDRENEIQVIRSSLFPIVDDDCNRHEHLIFDEMTRPNGFDDYINEWRPEESPNAIPHLIVGDTAFKAWLVEHADGHAEKLFNAAARALDLLVLKSEE